MDAVLEVECPGLVRGLKFAATSPRLHGVFGLHGKNRHSLDPDTDRKSTRGELRYCHRP
jgi:hypothetical protein